MTIIFWVDSTLGCDSICQIMTELQPQTCRTRGRPARALTAARQSAVRRAAACRPRATLFAPVRPVDFCITFHTRSRISAYLTYVRPHRRPESQRLRVHRHAVPAGAG